MAKAKVADALRLRQTQQIGDRDTRYPKDRVDPVQLQSLDYEVKAVGHIRRGICCAHVVHRSENGAGSNESWPQPSTKPSLQSCEAPDGAEPGRRPCDAPA